MSETYTKPSRGEWALRENWRRRYPVSGKEKEALARCKRFASPVFLDVAGGGDCLARIYLTGTSGKRTKTAAANASVIVTAKKLQQAVEHVLTASKEGDAIDLKMLACVLHESRTACPFEP